MTVFVSADQVNEYEVGMFNADASELGWAPGFVPEFIGTNLGNGLNLIRVRADECCFVYEQYCGSIMLTVYND